MKKQSVAETTQKSASHFRTLSGKLLEVLDEALEKADPSETALSIAGAVYDAELHRFAALFRERNVRWLAQMLRERRGPDPRQASLPGFEFLPRLVTVLTGKRIAIREATWTDLRDYRQRLTRKFRADPKVQEVERLMAMLKGKGRAVKVGDVL